MAPAIDLAYLYTDEDDIHAVLSVTGELALLDDRGTGQLSVAEEGFRDTIIKWATARCNYQLLGKYAASELANSWIVNDWCSFVAAFILGCRRGNTPAGALRELYEQAMEDMKLVRQGKAKIPDIGTRTSAWPFWSNVRVDVVHRVRKIRVQRSQSEYQSGAPGYNQAIDWPSDYIGWYE
jgi:hypothetical protein